jgi:hemolysin activation/secretion protein
VPSFTRVVLYAVSFFLFTGSVHAQVSVDGEEQRRRTQQEAEERLRRQQAPDVRLQQPAPAVEAEAPELPDETPCLLTRAEN